MAERETESFEVFRMRLKSLWFPHGTERLPYPKDLRLVTANHSAALSGRTQMLRKRVTLPWS